MAMRLLIYLEVRRNMALEEAVNRSVLSGQKEPDPRPDALRVGVDDEDRMSPGVEEDRVRGLRPDAILGQEIRAHHVHWTAEVARQVAAGSFEEMAAEPSDPRGVGAVEARDPHLAPDDGHGRLGQGPDIEESRSPQVPDRDLGVPPRGLLH